MDILNLIIKCAKVYHRTYVTNVKSYSYYDDKLDEWIHGQNDLSSAKAVTDYWVECNGDKVFLNIQDIKLKIKDWEYHLYNDAIAFRNWCDRNAVKLQKI